MRTSAVQRADMLTAIVPTREEQRAVEEARGFMNAIASFWSALLYGELPIVFTEDVPLAATDGHSVFLNIKACLALGWTVENICFVLAHEVAHYMLGHMIMNAHWRKTGQVTISGGNAVPFIHSVMNVAMDYVINAMLIKGKIGVMPKEGLFDPYYSAEGMESCVEVYEKLYSENSSDPSQGKGFDEHLEASPENQKADKANGESKRKQAIAAAAQVAEAAKQGDDLPGAVKRLIGEVLRPTVKWQDHLRSTMERSAGAPALDWRKVNRRRSRAPTASSTPRRPSSVAAPSSSAGTLQARRPSGRTSSSPR